MPMAYSTTFAVTILAGYLLTVGGAVLALLAIIWSVRAGDWAPSGTPPPAYRGLCTLAFALFVLGLFWQLLGYLRLNSALS